MSRANTDHEHFVAGQVTEAARHREQRILAALRPKEGERPIFTLEDVLRRTHRDGLPVLTQSATLADLRCLVDAGQIETVVTYRLPEVR